MKKITYTVKDDVPSLRKKLDTVFDNAYTGCVLALGFFDGVHVAHRELIARARSEASRLSLPLTVFTFSGSDEALKASSPRLYSDAEKLSLLAECGADAALIADFEAVSGLDKHSFIRNFAVGALRARVAVAGYNFRFGKGAEGTVRDLAEYMSAEGGECIIMEKRTENGIPVSSTRIRELLGRCDMRGAAKLLGKPYFITGKVMHGLGLGKSLGIPTVNTELPLERFSVPRGVYLSSVSIGKRNYAALTNIGVCPTFGERASHAETYILDFEGDLYDEEIRIYLCDYLRIEKKFAGKAELIEQIKSDTDRALALWEEIKWQEIGLS